MMSETLGGSSSDTFANPGCEEPFQLPLFSLEDNFNLVQPPLDLDFYQPRLSPTAVVPNMYSSSQPSPPAVPSSSSAASAASTRKKRKKDASPPQDEPNVGFEWHPYTSPAVEHAIFSQSSQPLTDQFELSMQKIEANTHYSATDNAWICYRQNQFKVICSLKSPHGEGSFYVQENGGAVAVQQFCAKLYAIKEINSAVGEEMRVGLHHVGKSRVKKEKLDIGITPFTNGRVEFSNVQFERSNAVKGQQLEYFHLVLAFYAKSFSNTYYHIFSRMSMRLIVRSQNPGFYGDSPVNAPTESQEDVGSGKSAGNSPARDADSSPGSSHDSLSPLPTYAPNPGPTLLPTTPNPPNSMAYPFANPNNSAPELKFTSGINDFSMMGTGHPSLAHQQPPPFSYQPPQTLTQPPPFMPTIMNNNNTNVNNVNNVISNPANPIIRLNSTNINTTTTDIIYSNYNNNNNNNSLNSNNNNNNNNNFMNPGMTTFGRDSQNTSLGLGATTGPWKSEPGPSNGSAPGPSSSRPPGGGGGGGGSGGGSGGGDGNRGGGMGGEPAWQQFSDVVVHHGKVGINTFTPLEALTVNGNILVTGNVYKPSDQRIKSEITEVDSNTQLANVRNLKIYDYIVRSQQERGVLAQELQAIMPHAVNNVGQVDNIPNFLVINERVLLFENIGATQQLDKELETEKQTIVEIDSRVAELKETTAQENIIVQDKISNLFDILFAEENGEKLLLAGLEEEYLNIGFSIFKMGPPRSFFLTGFLFPLTWSLGALYVFSNIGSRRVMGFSNLLMLVSYFVLYFCTQFYMLGDDVLTKVQVVWVGVGIILLLINYVRMRSRLQKQMKIDKEKERARKKAAIKKKMGQVTKKNQERGGVSAKGDAERRRQKKKEKVSSPVIIDVVEPLVEPVVVIKEECKEDEVKLNLKAKAPMREIQEIEAAERQRELEMSA